MISAALLTLLLCLAWFAPKGRDRGPTIHRYVVAIMACGAVLMALNHDWWPLALWVLVCVNALRKNWPAMHLTKLASGLVLYGVYAIARPLVTPEVTILLLVGIVYVGIVQALYYFKTRNVHENHLDMLLVMAMACAYSLMILHHWAWIAAVPILLIPLTSRIGQAWLWLAVAVVAVWGVLSPYSFLLIPACMPLLAYKAWSYRTMYHGPDHGRVRIWSTLLWGWWKSSWGDRLFGLGIGSWNIWAESLTDLETKTFGPTHRRFTWRHPHNEYIHMLFEHGVVGLLLLLGWIGSLLYMAPRALLIPGLTLCAIAFTCYPWTLVAEYPKQEVGGQIDFQAGGSMGMVITTLIVLCLL